MAKKKKKKKLCTLDKVLIFCACCLILFTIVQIVLFVATGQEMSTLIMAFFGAFGIETINCVMVYKDKQKRANTKELRASESEVDTYD